MTLEDAKAELVDCIQYGHTKPTLELRASVDRIVSFIVLSAVGTALEIATAGQAEAVKRMAAELEKL